MAVDWEAVYRESWSDLVGYLYHKVWDEERARDLAQEAFVRALHTQPDSPRSWLFTIAANLARDEARGAVRRRRHLMLLEAQAPAAEPARDVLGDMEREEQSRRVRVALDALKDRDREVLLLHQAGLDYGEIATRSGLSKGSVGTTLSRARRRLLEAYQETEEGRDAARG
ncbi:MAG: sigma-70 family RNA polymerase sigma factor [Gemmatimonadota bacterium]